MSHHARALTIKLATEIATALPRISVQLRGFIALEDGLQDQSAVANCPHKLASHSQTAGAWTVVKRRGLCFTSVSQSCTSLAEVQRCSELVTMLNIRSLSANCRMDKEEQKEEQNQKPSGKRCENELETGGVEPRHDLWHAESRC